MDKFFRKSVATIDSPEFLNITSISPLISKCEIKVMYVGENRNRSYITKEVATQMAQTLRGVPIVGYWSDSKEDFLDHGERVIIDGEGVKFKDMTKPYGFVSPDSKIWFQKFDDTDEFGNTVTREYLMTEGYLWTESYEECKRIMESGNPQSMKLNEASLKGYWSTDNNRGIDFFIINDALFENLCILGEDVEPCFEGADITAPKLSSNFSKNDNFVRSLFTMMEELKNELKNEGGASMNNEETTVFEAAAEVVEENVEQEVVETTETQEIPATESSLEENSEVVDNSVENVEAEIEETTEEFSKEKDEEGCSTNHAKSEQEDKKEEEESASEEKEDEADDEEDKKKAYELLQEEYSALKESYDVLNAKYESISTEYASLVEFKNSIEEQKKTDLIESFYMLSDEDKKDVIENKAQYSLDEIESKLSVICVRKRVNFDSLEQIQKDTKIETNTTFNLNSLKDAEVPAIIAALRSTKNSRN